MARFQVPAVPASVGDALVERGLLARETDVAQADVVLKGGSYGYTRAFWEKAGALARPSDGQGWTVVARTPEEQAAVRARLVEEWVAAGAPREWASTEADLALESLLAGGPQGAGM